MNILFLFQRFSFESSTIYLDLVRECADRGHRVYILAGSSEQESDGVKEAYGCRICYVKLPDQFKSGKIKKGLVQLLIEPIFLNVLKKNLWQERIDLIAYPTPPITLSGVVRAAKKHYGAVSYLMLKDIFPQNAADLGMMNKISPVFLYFRLVEKALYKISDHIGCMSPANIEYMRKYNPETSQKLELFPNSVKIKPLEDRSDDVGFYPKEGPVSFVLGGNLGKPQAIGFILKLIDTLCREDFRGACFTIIGTGTEQKRVEAFFNEKKPFNACFHENLPREEYERLLMDQEVGIISLSPDFTIPNFPSRLLSYMQMAKPVLVLTDKNTDIGRIVCGAGFGFYASSDDVKGAAELVKEVCKRRSELAEMGLRGREYLKDNYDVQQSADILERAAGLDKKCQ